MKNIDKYILAVLMLIGGIALLWGGYGQPSPNSYFLYLGGSLAILVSVGIATGQVWARVGWAALVTYYFVTRLFFFRIPLGSTSLQLQHMAVSIAILFIPVVIGYLVWLYMSRLNKDNK